jgi:cell division protein FtsN
MSRDYRRRAEPRSHRSTPGWVLFTVGFIAGAFSVGLAWVKLGPPELKALSASLQAAAQAPPAAKAEEPPKHAGVPRPQFQFYSLLPEREVMVSEDEVDRRAKASSSVPSPRPPAAAPPGAPVVTAETPPAPPAQPAPHADEVLMLQVAAFKAKSDAENLKAQLALKGLQAGVESANIKGESYHRVRLGPYRSIEQLQSVRSRLRNGGFDSVVVRLK